MRAVWATPFILAGLVACQPAPQQATTVEHFDVSVDTKGEITLNGMKVTEEQLKAQLENASAAVPGNSRQ